MANADLSADYLRALFSYDPSTGDFTRSVQCGRRGKIGAVAGSIETQGYVCIAVDGKTYKAHRLAWLVTYGEWPAAEVDHINGQRADNRIANLRLASRATNMQNQSKAHARKNSTGMLGVSRRKGYFEARIQVDKRLISIGRFSTPEAAHEAYLESKRLLHETCVI